MAAKVKKHPKSVKEAVDILIDELPLNDQIRLANLDKESLIDLHFGLGMDIRNKFGLLDKNEQLITSCSELTAYKDIDPDEASEIIIEELWKKLQSKKELKPIEEDEIIEDKKAKKIPKVVWKAVDDIGKEAWDIHGVQFHLIRGENDKPEYNNMIAFLNGYEWLHGSPDEIVMLIIRATNEITIEQLNDFKKEFEEKWVLGNKMASHIYPLFNG